jgi:hypothetical protein
LLHHREPANRGSAQAFPQAKWISTNLQTATTRGRAIMALGQSVNITYRFGLADRILSLDCDFLLRQFTSLRTIFQPNDVTEEHKEMSRLT